MHTEAVKGNSNPKFSQPVLLDFYFEVRTRGAPGAHLAGSLGWHPPRGDTRATRRRCNISRSRSLPPTRRPRTAA